MQFETLEHFADQLDRVKEGNIVRLTKARNCTSTKKGETRVIRTGRI
jgi:antitoxin (DNA-binding transcriptional repressor) of toxin-antitoxin stability system